MVIQDAGMHASMLLGESHALYGLYGPRPKYAVCYFQRAVQMGMIEPGKLTCSHSQP